MTTIQEQLRDDVVVLRRRTKGLPDIERADRIASAADRISELEAATKELAEELAATIMREAQGIVRIDALEAALREVERLIFEANRDTLPIKAGHAHRIAREALEASA